MAQTGGFVESSQSGAARSVEHDATSDGSQPEGRSRSLRRRKGVGRGEMKPRSRVLGGNRCASAEERWANENQRDSACSTHAHETTDKPPQSNARREKTDGRGARGGMGGGGRGEMARRRRRREGRGRKTQEDRECPSRSPEGRVEEGSKKGREWRWAGTVRAQAQAAGSQASGTQCQLQPRRIQARLENAGRGRAVATAHRGQWRQ
jgi:hypothetical protein